MKHAGSIDTLRPLTLLLLMASVATVALGYGIALPIFPELMDHGMDAAAKSWHLGMLTTAYMLALTLSAPVWGGLSDRTSRRAIIFIGLSLSIVGIIVLLLALRPWVLYTSQVIFGIATAAVIPVSLAYVAETTSPGTRSRRFAWMGAAATTGVLGGPALGGWLAGPSMDVFGISIQNAAERPLVAAGFLTVLTLSAAVIGLSKAGKPVPCVTNRPWTTQIKIRSVAPWLLLAALAAYGLGSLELAATLRGQQSLQLGPPQLADLFVTCGVVMLVVQGIFGSGGMWPLDPRRLATPAFVVMAIGLALAPVASGPRTLMFFIGAAAAGYGVLVIGLADGISRNAAGQQGGALGQQMSAAALGQAIGSAVTGLLSGSSISAASWVGAGVLLIGATLAAVPRLLGRNA